ncbi:MAG: hypothetical protein IPL46_23090 [Saprospiraceae bacterium]|nr:hypothetical protein [Saprospiraceae bacterium]
MADRIEIAEGRPQIFGSQVKEQEDGTYTILPVMDVDQVDERRAFYRMEPLADYPGNYFNIKLE